MLAHDSSPVTPATAGHSPVTDGKSMVDGPAAAQTMSASPMGNGVVHSGGRTEAEPYSTIKPIETEYAGCLFRSRLEARWAVFFDHLGIEWEHEPDGFATSAGPYLPDFRIATLGEWHWFEVKPEGFTSDRRHVALVEESSTPLIVASGMPRDYADQMDGHRSALRAILSSGQQYPCAFLGGDHRTGQNSAWDSLHDGRVWWMQAWHQPHICLATRWRYGAPRAVRIPDGECVGDYPPFDSGLVDAAYKAARSARFGR